MDRFRGAFGSQIADPKMLRFCQALQGKRQRFGVYLMEEALQIAGVFFRILVQPHRFNACSRREAGAAGTKQAVHEHAGGIQQFVELVAFIIEDGP